ncbi:MAG: carboxylesterase/lipase family protein [Promethearchaeota archaeon]
MKKTEIIKTESGNIQGYTENGIEIFKGIPFAEPPIGDLRFCPPVIKKPWDGVFDSTKYGPCAYQGFTNLEEWFGKLEHESEDCLNLNIWTPAADGKKRPVMVWIHGGAFITGSGCHEFYDGSALTKRGNVVIVTINYRLGALGYLYIPGATANVGQLDQIAALKWVHNNIEAFGGDPDNVTIFGESAGGYAVVTLPAMPAAKGLFHRVIAQSAPYFDPEVSEKNTKTLMRKLKVKKGDIDALRKLPAKKIIEAQDNMMETDISNLLAFRPLIDGDIIPKHPLEAYRNGECKDIEFIIGSNLDEAKLFTALAPELNSRIEAGGDNMLIILMGMLKIEKTKSREILDTYKKAREGKFSIEPVELLNVLINDGMFRIPTIRLLEAQSKHQPNTYNYMFTYPSPYLNGTLGSPHAVEIPFVFNSLDIPLLDGFVGNGPSEQVLSEKVMDAWIAFAHTGNPNHDNLPQWPSYKVDQRATMFLGNECNIVNAAFDKEREAWDGLLDL